MHRTNLASWSAIYAFCLTLESVSINIASAHLFLLRGEPTVLPGGLLFLADIILACTGPYAGVHQTCF